MENQAMQRDLTQTILRARTEADALGQLYELYYDRMYRFCVHRLFTREAAEEVTSTIFLQMAQSMGRFSGRSEEDFRCWLYAIAANQVNAYIRKAVRHKRHWVEVARRAAADRSTADGGDDADWPRVYRALLKLEPGHQNLVTLRFFENLSFEEIGKILNAPAATLRVTLHRVLKKLRADLQGAEHGGVGNA